MSGRPLRLLLVEDSEDDALLILRELRANGYEPSARRIETAEALRGALDSGPWDLVVSDFSLPGFSGPEALAIVRERDRDLPFIIISGAIGEERAVNALKAGAQDFVSKGNLARLVPAIERELREAASRRRHGEATRALRERDELLRALVDAAPAGILVVDPGGRIRISNRAADAIFGAGSEDATGSSGPSPEAIRPILARCLAGESIHEERVARSGGTARQELEVSAGPIRGASGDVTGAVVVAIDVTQRTDLEQQLRQAQKLEAVGRLAGGVAHDFNNILTAISGYADFLIDDLPEGPQRSDATEIRRAAERGSSLTRQLLALSRKQVLQPEHLDLGMVVQGVDKMLRRIIGEDVVFDVQTEGELPVVADRGQLEQILLNLVVNARDAMPQGGRIEVRAHRADPGEALSGWAVLEVVDEGTGMSPETLGRIFEPFFTTKDPGRGTGLGLSTVYGIVTQNGGRIDVDSEAGKGTRFRVYLPLAAEAPATAPAEEEQALPVERDRAATILVIEDDDAIRTVTVRALREAGFTVLEAENGEAALSEADRASGEIDLLLVDVILPRGNGPATAERIRERHGISRVLFMSGYTGDALANHPEVGLHGNLIAKPFGQRELIARLDEMLAGS